MNDYTYRVDALAALFFMGLGLGIIVGTYLDQTVFGGRFAIALATGSLGIFAGIWISHRLQKED